MLFRGWMLRDLERAKALVRGRGVIWSQGKGYLKEGSGAQLKADCLARGIPLEIIHTSGHASVVDLKRLATAVSPKVLVPIYTFGRGAVPGTVRGRYAASGWGMVGGPKMPLRRDNKYWGRKLGPVLN